MVDPVVGQEYIATDNAGAMAALVNDRYPVPQGVMYVTVEKVWPDDEKLQVNPDGMWLTYAELERWFRRTSPRKDPK